LLRNKFKIIKRKKRSVRNIGIEETENNEYKNPIRVKRNNYINGDNDNDPFGYLALQKFIDEKFVFISEKIPDYPEANRPLKRKIITYFHLILDSYFIIRFGLLTVIDKFWIWDLLADSNYVFEKRNLISLIIFIFGAMILAYNYLVLNYEKNKKMEIFSYLNKIHKNLDSIKLEHRYYSKFCKTSKFLVKHILGFNYYLLFIIPLIHEVFKSVKAYFDPDLKFPLIKLLINFLLNAIWFKHFVSLI
jgi:hypothetical protein